MSQKPFSMTRKILVSIVIDTLVLAVFLLTFAYFHHVRVRNEAPTAIASSAAVSQSITAAQPTASPEAQPTTSADAGQQDAPSSDGLDTSGQFGAKFADQFAQGDTVESGDTFYRSKNISITLEQKQTDNTTYFLADIYVRDINCFRTAVALEYKEHNDTNRKNCMQVLQLDELTGAILALSGDNYVFRNAGLLAIRNGLEWEKDLPFSDDICTLFYDGTMETFSSKSSSVIKQYVEELYTRSPYQVWCFGPMLLDAEGQPMTKFNSSVGTENPRSVFGYYEPGHYCFLLADGRQKNYSIGLTLTQMSQIFYDLGCKAAYNLDGGDTVAMTFNDALVNHPEEAEPRAVSDILYIAEPQEG